uniref:Serine/threonine kinase 40 n=1 Tax=Nothobranchius kuhntae TaxID=321403 RepID=A0A1A8KAA9_NOTKU
MSKRRSSERGAGETSRASQLQCPGINGSNAKRAGPFILGPRLGNSPVPSIVQCLARKDGTDDFYQLKILTLEERADSAGETQEERQGKMLLHTEYSLLSLLHNQDGVHLVSEDDLLKDQRGSPAYISPDVLSGRPYHGKPSDMWALGVVLFTMLYGQFPFYDSIPQELFRKIKAAEYSIPEDGRVSENTVCLIRKLLVLDPQQRLTAGEVLESLSAIIASWQSISSMSGPLQVVPDIDDQLNHPEHLQEAKAIEESSQYEFENYMRQQLLLAEEKNTCHDAKSFLSNRQFGSIPPVRRLGHDAQPVSPLDAAILAQRFLRK